MGLLSTSKILERDDVPDDVKDEILEIKKHTTLLDSKVKLLEAQKKKLEELVSKHKRSKEVIVNKLSINPTTGLANHYKMNNDLPEILKAAKTGNNISVAVFIVKLDRTYDMVNKTLKASMSEWILYQTGTRLQETLGSKDYIYHTREDEFVIIATEAKDYEDICNFGDRYRNEVIRSHIFSGYHISLNCHIGIALFPEHGFNKRTLLHNADIALEYAKERNSPFQIYTEELRDKVIERMELQNYIIKALEAQAILEINKQFELFFQPIVEVEKVNSHHSIINIEAEALIRWHHPTKGMIEPGKFISIAEETGLIMPIGNWVLYNSTDHLKAWNNSDNVSTTLSINLSPIQFSSGDIIDRLKRVVESREIDSASIRIEITENCVMEDPVESIKKMHALNDLGFSLAIDDFGTGYSSLNYLREFPIDMLKIDKTFVTHIANNQYDQAIVKAILAMARELKLKVVAEGIEKSEQFHFLVNEGCNMFQGYLFSRPRNASSFIDFYTNQKDTHLEVN